MHASKWPRVELVGIENCRILKFARVILCSGVVVDTFIIYLLCKIRNFYLISF